jgi:hypothetical protein
MGCLFYASANSNIGAWPLSATAGSSAPSCGANSYSLAMASTIAGPRATVAAATSGAGPGSWIN